MAAFQRAHGLTGLPLYGKGYSSGGTMLLKLIAFAHAQGSKVRFDGLATVDAAPRGGFGADDYQTGKMRKGLRFPPTLFIVAKVS